jgi:hypothetical protein
MLVDRKRSRDRREAQGRIARELPTKARRARSLGRGGRVRRGRRRVPRKDISNVRRFLGDVASEHEARVRTDDLRCLRAPDGKDSEGLPRVVDRLFGAHHAVVIGVAPTAKRPEDEVRKCGAIFVRKRARELVCGARAEHRHARERRRTDGHERLKSTGDGVPLRTATAEARIHDSEDFALFSVRRRSGNLALLHAARIEARGGLLRIDAHEHAFRSVLGRGAVADKDDPERAACLNLLRRLFYLFEDALACGLRVAKQVHALDWKTATVHEEAVPIRCISRGARHTRHRKVVLHADDDGRVAIAITLRRCRRSDIGPRSRGKGRRRDKQSRSQHSREPDLHGIPLKRI